MKYSLITIYTTEGARWKGKPLYSAISDYLTSLSIAARCIVTNGIAGFYENGEQAASNIEVLAHNLPCKIEILMPEREAEIILSKLEEMVTDGIVTVSNEEVRVCRVKKNLIPQNSRVRDLMMSNPPSVNADSSAGDAVKLLIRADFKGVPVVDYDHRPVGIITQSDLVARAGLRVRPGLLADFSWEQIDDLVKPLGWKKASEIMSKPVVCIHEEAQVCEAVEIMLKRNLKSIPVTDKNGALTGIIDRLDIFRAVSVYDHSKSESETTCTWHGLVRLVKDVMRSDLETVYPDTRIEAVLKKINPDNLQRVVVTDKSGKFLGLISDKDLLVLFLNKKVNVWEYIISNIPFSEAAKIHRKLLGRLKIRTASDVMNTNITTVSEDTTIIEAMKLMTEKNFKRLPVVDENGIFRGMINMESVLRAGVE
jgi:CBS domain-containing protein